LTKTVVFRQKAKFLATSCVIEMNHNEQYRRRVDSENLAFSGYTNANANAIWPIYYLTQLFVP